MPILKTCVVCSKEFKVPPSRAESAKTCSNECAYVVRGESNQKRVTLACKHCSKTFDVPECHAVRRSFCSHECKNASPEKKLAQSIQSTGAKNPYWKGGVSGSSDGYVLVTSADHPFKVNGYVFQHRLVVEDRMRREAPDHHFIVEIDGVKYLRRDIDVHHKNEVNTDNRPENLIACTAAAHRDMHDGRPVMRGTVWPEADHEIEFTDRQVQCKCEKCGDLFTKGLADVKRGSGRFCSRVCYDAFMARRSKVLEGYGKFCSNDCRHQARVGVHPTNKL
jgi:hypothetical protein